MGSISWGRSLLDAIRRGDTATFRVKSKGPYKKILQIVNGLADPGVPIYDLNWDLLIILDACRADLMQEIVDDYDFLDGSGTIRSVGSVTREWMEKNFIAEYEEEMRRTSYVCGNPHSDSVLDSSKFSDLHEVWRDAWVDPGTVPPEALTNKAIEEGRSGYDRMIVHYMQPHCPFLSAPELSAGKRLENFGNQPHDDVWTLLEKGRVDKEAVWAGYRDNLRIGLEEVSVLLENIDASDVLITSDHGNALGEWGLYGHPDRMPFESLREVPYYRTRATDQRTRTESELAVETTDDDSSVEERLRSLGYV